MDLDALKRQLIHDEGLRLKPYKDSKGIWTILVGHNMEAKPLSLDMQRRLAEDGALVEMDAIIVLHDDITEHCILLDKYLPWWSTKLDDARQNALVNMAFNLGVGPSDEQPDGKILQFKNSLALLERGEYEKAAANFAMSAWYKQVGQRAVRLVAIIKGTA